MLLSLDDVVLSMVFLLGVCGVLAGGVDVLMVTIGVDEAGGTMLVSFSERRAASNTMLEGDGDFVWYTLKVRWWRNASLARLLDVVVLMPLSSLDKTLLVMVPVLTLCDAGGVNGDVVSCDIGNCIDCDCICCNCNG